MTAKRKTKQLPVRLQLDALAITKPSDAEPKWNQLFPLGSRHRSDFPGGKIEFTTKFLATMVENWKRMGGPALPADYLHRGDAGGDDLPVDEKVASGWIEDLQLRDDGLWGLFRWTDRARKYITSDELRYLSPTFATDSINRTTGKTQGPTLYGAALLNTPFLTDLPRVAASSTAVPPAHTQPADEAKDSNMDKKLICAALGLAEDATDEAVMAAIAESTAAKAATAKLSAEKDEAVKLSAGVEPLRLQVTALASKVDALEVEKAKLELSAKTVAIDGLVAKLEAEHRILPANREAVKKFALTQGVAEAATFFGAFPPVVPVGELGTGSVKADSPEAAYAALKLAADELVKKGAPQGDSMLRAIAENPTLAEAAASMQSPKRN